jgi:DNA repair ATPase RecN
MPEETSNLTSRMLRVMDEKLDRLIEDVHDVKLRLTAVEEALAGVNRRIDCTETRLDRIEKRLNLVDAS